MQKLHISKRKSSSVCPAQRRVIKSQCTTEHLCCLPADSVVSRRAPTLALAILCRRREYDLVPVNYKVHSLLCLCSHIALGTAMQLNNLTWAKTCLPTHRTQCDFLRTHSNEPVGFRDSRQWIPLSINALKKTGHPQKWAAAEDVLHYSDWRSFFGRDCFHSKVLITAWGPNQSEDWQERPVLRGDQAAANMS